MNIRQFISSQYLLDPHPNPDFALLWPLVAVFGLIFLIGCVVSLVRRLRSWPWRDRLAQWLRWLGFTGLLLLFARYQSLPYLSPRITWYILLLGFLGWLSFIWYKVRQEKKVKKQDNRFDTFEKYLPRPRQKR